VLKIGLLSVFDEVIIRLCQIACSSTCVDKRMDDPNATAADPRRSHRARRTSNVDRRGVTSGHSAWFCVWDNSADWLSPNSWPALARQQEAILDAIDTKEFIVSEEGVDASRSMNEATEDFRKPSDN
jgi:hypothetical protein